jgi:hypothetical protein
MLGLDGKFSKDGAIHDELPVDFMKPITVKGEPSRYMGMSPQRGWRKRILYGGNENAGPPCHLAMGADRRLVGSELL